MSSKPTLTLVSPFPPQKTGVADYLMQLLPALAHHYELVLVVDDEAPAIPHFDFPGKVVPANKFLNDPTLHQRVVYQIGNSPWHLYALELLKHVPGSIVMHDFFLGNALAYAQWNQSKTDALLLSLLQSHGLKILPELTANGIHYCIDRYPANFPVLSKALAIGVHSQYIADISKKYFGSQLNHLFHSLPFPKELKPILSKFDRQKIFDKHDFPQDAFIISSFGFGSPAKQHELILSSWINSDLSEIDNAFLVFSGEYFSDCYLKQLQYRIPENLKNRIRFTGFTSKEDYDDYLAISSLAIQLRNQSRGENSAAIMDCFSAGVPVIANDHGTIQELPNNILWKISHPACPSTIINTIEHLYHHPEIGLTIAENARKHLDKKHNLAQAGAAYFSMIEGSLTLLQSQTEAFKPKKPISSEPNRPQLLLDVTDTVKQDKRTGIQRVVRGLLNGLLNIDSLETPFAICPIYLDAHGVYRHARQYTLNQFGITCATFSDDLVSPQKGDVYLDLDFNTISAVEQESTFDHWRSQGIYVARIVYDLLPLENPAWFLPFMEELYTTWFKSILHHSDALLAISRTVAKQIKDHVNNEKIYGSVSNTLKVGHFNLGNNLSASFPSKGIPAEALSLLAKLQKVPSILMVSTLEPRKAYQQSLDALDYLWSKDIQINLVIVGKVGWQSELLVKRISNHPQLGKQLFWLANISDEYLDLLYQNASALLMASYGEGFGLPIAEAAKHLLPVIARKLPVFEELGERNISYFEAQNGVELGQYLQFWIMQDSSHKPDIGRFNHIDWNTSASQILHLIEELKKAK
jgi:glycosyltransferase involved in cell wall biosynthesis